MLYLNHQREKEIEKMTTVEKYEREEMRKTAEIIIANNLKGIERERNKHYKIEANREKKINKMYDNIAFWSTKLVENKF